MSATKFTIKVVTKYPNHEPVTATSSGDSVWEAHRWTTLHTDELEDIQSVSIVYLDGSTVDVQREDTWAPPTGQPVPSPFGGVS
jgi:hypothetical protein